MIISISGQSGVGKTTIAHLISCWFPNGESLIISGDNFHKWERASPNWEKFTHFNPESNKLNLAYEVIKKLSKGESVRMSEYEHSSGKFTPKKLFTKCKNIIYEGLHALYGENIRRISDLKIYVDTDDALAKEWKIRRDIQTRGYSKSTTESQILFREKDKIKFIIPQKKFADIIIKFSKNKHGLIDLKITKAKKGFSRHINEIKSIFKNFRAFLDICRSLSSDISLIQHKGGNISVKYDDKILIKSSGHRMSDVSALDGFVICQNFLRSEKFCSEHEYETFIRQILYHGKDRPSIEAGFHCILKKRFILHTHPIYLNCILCTRQAEELLKKIFPNLDYQFVVYNAPGYKLSNNFINTKNKNIIFLENHGLIIACDDYKSGIKLTKQINEKCKKWIEENSDIFIQKNEKTTEKRILFPDAVVFDAELKILNDFILFTSHRCNLNEKELTENEQKEISCLIAEKYRKQK